jgi:hypothetical protein
MGRGMESRLGDRLAEVRCVSCGHPYFRHEYEAADWLVEYLYEDESDIRRLEACVTVATATLAHLAEPAGECRRCERVWAVR